MKIIKRDGIREDANPQKIKIAISKAFKANGYELDEKLLEEITNSVKLWDDITIEDIQDEVIEILRNYGYDEVADSYLIYKYKHDQARKMVKSKKEFIKK